MELAEILPAGIYSCWRCVCTTQPGPDGWKTDTSPPYLTRGGAIAAAANYRMQIDDSRGRAMASPWHQTNIASSENIFYPEGEMETGDIAWENSHGETVEVRRSDLIVGA